MGLLGCTPVICPAIRRHTAVFGCQKKWQFIFFKTLQSVPRWQFIKDRRRITRPIHAPVTDTHPRLRLWSAETDLNCLTFPRFDGQRFGRNRTTRNGKNIIFESRPERYDENLQTLSARHRRCISPGLKRRLAESSWRTRCLRRAGHLGLL